MNLSRATSLSLCLFMLCAVGCSEKDGPEAGPDAAIEESTEDTSGPSHAEEHADAAPSRRNDAAPEDAQGASEDTQDSASARLNPVMPWTPSQDSGDDLGPSADTDSAEHSDTPHAGDATDHAEDATSETTSPDTMDGGQDDSASPEDTEQDTEDANPDTDQCDESNACGPECALCTESEVCADGVCIPAIPTAPASATAQRR